MSLKEKLVKIFADVRDEYGLGKNKLKVLLVCGQSSLKLSGAKDVIESIADQFEFIIFDQFSPDPKLEEIQVGIELVKEENPDLVMAIGGGSAIDTAKVLNFFGFNNFGVEEYIAKPKSFEVSKPKYFIAIPTTAGTGSEATHFAVLYIKKVKYSIAHQFMLPSNVILEPSLTMKLPARITAATAMDAYCQAIEAYWSVSSNDESNTYALEAIEIIHKNIVSVVTQPDENSRLEMLKAANLSGKAINITKTTACHAISYSLTTHFGLAHGHAVAMTLAKVMELNYQLTVDSCNDPRGADFVKSKIEKIWQMIGCANMSEARVYFDDLMDSINLEKRFSQLNVKDTDFIADEVNAERLGNNPRRLSNTDIIGLLQELH